MGMFSLDEEYFKSILFRSAEGASQVVLCVVLLPVEEIASQSPPQATKPHIKGENAQSLHSPLRGFLAMVQIAYLNGLFGSSAQDMELSTCYRCR